jgi:hypothetical protein
VMPMTLMPLPLQMPFLCGDAVTQAA